MTFDLFCCYFGDGVYAFKTKVKGIVFKTIVDASCFSEALTKGKFNIRNKFKEEGLCFERGMVQWNVIQHSFTSDDNHEKDPERCWYIEESNGHIIPKKSSTPLMTLDECKAYILARLFK